MAREQGPMSGFRDMLAEQMIPRQAMLGTIQSVYEGYGFTPLKTPALERRSTLIGKYGEEGDKLMYDFEDNGGRMIALRYDHTVPLARVVAQHGGQLPTPYKRYVVGEVWRGESPQAGRYREFTQFDADTVGTKSPVADAEIVAMMSDSMEALGAESLIRVNNRRILDGVVEMAGAGSLEDGLRMINIIDKVEKIGRSGVRFQIEEKFGGAAADLVDSYLDIEGTSAQKLNQISKLLSGSATAEEGVENLAEVFKLIEAGGFGTDKVVFDQTIARGLDYYTGIVYETTLTGASSLGSVCSGGRFDNLVEAMGGPDTPAVGTSIGVDRLYDGLQQIGQLKEARTPTEVLVTNFEAASTPDYMRVAAGIRKLGLAAEIYYEDVKLGKQIKFADKMKIPFVVIIGPDEQAAGSAIIKTMESGEQLEVPVSELPATIMDLKDK